MAVGHLKFVADLIQSDKRLSNDARLLIWHGGMAATVRRRR